MKKLIIILLLATTTAYCQEPPIKHIHVSAGSGYLFTTERPAMEFIASYSTDMLSANAGYIVGVNSSRQDIAAVFFKAGIGLPIRSTTTLQLGTGYCQHVARDTKTTPTGMGIMFSLFVYQDIRLGSLWSVYAGVSKTRAVTAVTSGLRYRLFNVSRKTYQFSCQ